MTTVSANRTLPRRRNTRRPGIVYAYETACVDRRGMPASGTEEGYVGQSRQTLEQRDAQHMGARANRSGVLCPQPWSDLVRRKRVVEQGMWTDADLDAREQYWITKLKPRYNWEHNEGPHRVGVLDARAQRDARDRAAGLPERVWPPLRGQASVRPARRVSRVRRPRSWRTAIAVGVGVLVAAATVGVPGVVALLLGVLAGFLWASR